MIGEKFSPVLEEIEDCLWEFEAKCSDRPNFTDNGFRAAIKIFMCAIMDKMYKLQDSEEIAFEDKCNMAKKCGEDLKQFVKTYTNINSHDLYKKTDTITETA